MKILVFCQYYYPERFLITEICERLVYEGHEVTVLTGYPNYNFPGNRVPKEYFDGSHDTETINGVHILRCRVCGRGQSKIRLFCNYFSYAFNAKRLSKSLSAQFDVVYVYQLTPILQLWPAIRYCRKHKKKLFCYVLDIAPASGERYLKHHKILTKLYSNHAEKLYKACDLIGVTSKSFIDYMKIQNHICAEKLTYLPQHGFSDILNQDLSKMVGEIRHFCFAGNLGKGASLETILRAAELLRHQGFENFKIHFVGTGSAKESLLKLRDMLKLDNCVVFEDAVPMEEMPDIYRKMDALIITLRKGQITVPGKLQSYMATGKPIFGAMDGSGKELILEAECGLCADAEDSEQLAKNMASYIENPDKYIQAGENGRSFFAKNFTLEKHTKELIKHLELLGECI